MSSRPQYNYVDDASARIRARIKLAREAFQKASEGSEEEQAEALARFELALDDVEKLARELIGGSMLA